MIIALEGLDGVGKSTLAQELVEAYSKKGYKVSTMRFPYNNEYREEIKKHIEHGEIFKGNERAILSLCKVFSEDRYSTEMDDSDIIICDRFILSNMFTQRPLLNNMVDSFGARAIEEMTLGEFEHNKDRKIVNVILSMKFSEIERVVSERNPSKTGFVELEDLEKLKRAHLLVEADKKTGFLTKLIESSKEIPKGYHRIEHVEVEQTGAVSLAMSTFKIMQAVGPII